MDQFGLVDRLNGPESIVCDWQSVTQGWGGGLKTKVQFKTVVVLVCEDTQRHRFSTPGK